MRIGVSINVPPDNSYAINVSYNRQVNQCNSCTGNGDDIKYQRKIRS